MRGQNHLSSFIKREGMAWGGEVVSSGPEQPPRLKPGSPGLQPRADQAAGPPEATAGHALGQPSPVVILMPFQP